MLSLAKRQVLRLNKNSRLSIQAMSQSGRTIWSVKYDLYNPVTEAFLAELYRYDTAYADGEPITAIRLVWRLRGESRGQGNARTISVAKAKWKEVSVVTFKNCLYAAYYLCSHPELAKDPETLNITDKVKDLKRRVKPLHKEFSSDVDVQKLATYGKAIIHVYNNLFALTKTFTPERVFTKRSGNGTPEYHIRLANTHYTALIPWEELGGYVIVKSTTPENDERELKKIEPRRMKSEIDTKIAAWDIEASTTADGDFKAYGVGCAWYGPEKKEEYVQFWGMDCLEKFAQWLVDNMAGFNKWTFYAHNGGRFDVALLLKESILRKCGLHVKGASAIELNGCWINIPLHDEVGNEIVMKDSLRMLPGSLADLTAQLKVKHQKLTETVSHDDITLDNWHTFPQLPAYLEHDCKGLLEVMHQFNEDVFKGFGIPMTKCFTSASLAKKAFFQGSYNQYKFPIYSLPQSMDAYLRKGYFGGRVECFHMGKVPGSKFYYYDFTSLFPSEGCKDLPFGKPVLVKANFIMPAEGVLSRRFFGFARCLVRTKYMDREVLPLHAVKANGKLMFPILDDWREMTLFSEEIRKGIALDIYEYQVLDGYAFDRAPILASFFKKGFTEKARAAAEDKPALSQAHKIVINSGYGFWGIRTENRDAVVCLTKDEIADLDAYEDTGKLKHVGYIGKYIMARVEKDLPVEDFNVSIAAAITSYARMKLYSAITAIQSKGHRVFYCDTDSIMTDCRLSDYPDLMEEFMWDGCGDALGALKNEADGKVKKAIKGLNLTVDEVREREGGMIHFDELVLNGSKFYSIQKNLPELAEPIVISKAKGFKAARDSTLTFADQLAIANGTPAEQTQMQFRLPRTAMCCETEPFKLSKVMVGKKFAQFYDKGTVLADGRIAPLVY